ncbi:MAG: T9SS type A sorting domain-containing protein [bacterium]
MIVKQDYTSGELNISLYQSDSVRKGEIVTANFTVVVPDSAISEMYLEPIIVTTDSLPFINIIPLLETATCVVSPKCGIHTLSYETKLPTLMQHAPNPVMTSTEIQFSLKESSSFELSLYSSDGKFIKSILQSNGNADIGEYSALLDVSDLANGHYFYVLEAGSFRATRKLHVIK